MRFCHDSDKTALSLALIFFRALRDFSFTTGINLSSHLFFFVDNFPSSFSKVFLWHQNLCQLFFRSTARSLNFRPGILCRDQVFFPVRLRSPPCVALPVSNLSDLCPSTLQRVSSYFLFYAEIVSILSVLDSPLTSLLTLLFTRRCTRYS